MTQTPYFLADLPGAQLNWQDSDGITCLMVAAERGNEDLLQLFLHHKADVHLNARDGSTAAHHAAKRGQIECLQHLLKAGSCIVATDALGRMLIHWAAEVGHVAMAKMLLEQGCPVSGGQPSVSQNSKTSHCTLYCFAKWIVESALALKVQSM